MRGIQFLAVSAAGLALNACAMASSSEPVDTPDLVNEGPCNAASAQRYIGASVSDEMRQSLIEETGAKVFQWVGPGMAVTMDYRTDRLRVSYDQAERITRIACG